jgi:hypothetical protein
MSNVVLFPGRKASTSNQFQQETQTSMKQVYKLGDKFFDTGV